MVCEGSKIGGVQPGVCKDSIIQNAYPLNSSETLVGGIKKPENQL
jgi:hypothetical protein